MRKGQNSIMVACTLELINLIRSHAGKDDQNEGFWLIKRLLKEDADFKAEFTAKYGKDKYQKTLKHYSRTNLEQRRLREISRKITEKKAEQKLEIEKMKAESYKLQVEGSLIEEPVKPKLSEKECKHIRKVLRKAKRQLKDAEKQLEQEQDETMKEKRKENIKRRKEFIEEYEEKLENCNENP